MAASLRNEDLIASARRRTISLPTISKATDHTTTKAKVLAVFPYPVRIWGFTGYVGDLFATNGITGTNFKIGTSADDDAVVTAIADLTSTQASGSALTITPISGLSANGYVLPAGTALLCTNTASAGAGTIDLFMTYEVLDNE